MPMALAEQYRNLYPFLGVVDREGTEPSEFSQPPSCPFGFSQLSPTLGLWPSDPEAFAGRRLRENSWARPERGGLSSCSR